ncbi:ExeA family protein [Frigidibacter sp. ROC022]|uniref:ExeA family protein n=1 Tax=Frigidibacter sp. ROC022 TaxID=2971796 RepID=UPI00215B5EB6|nr:AAA family ATPase [Frigidibacter sp. ROC022]MCR8726769.1 AAA family ATPase [Frigidibacter sp. ROC022]
MSMISSLDIYSEHFGLTERPFSLVPDPSFLYWSKQHRSAYTMLEYGLMTRAPITMITGEVGAGKTTLLLHLLQMLDDQVQVGMISNAHSSDRSELIRWIMQSLSQEMSRDASFVEMFKQFQDYLVDEYAKGRRVILVFDEAQNLNRETLEELRMLTNINSNKDVLLQLVLVGQPELRDIVRNPDLVQFSQRIAASFHIPAMDGDTVRSYIEHRLRVAGAKTMFFEDDACQLIYEVTGGVPRLVNQLCDLAMVYGFSEGGPPITLSVVRQILSDGAFFGVGALVLRNKIN